MPDKFDALFDQLLEKLQSAEKRRNAAEALRIADWRKSLETLRAEIAASGLVSDGGPEGNPNGDIKTDMYVRGRLRELSGAGFEFTDKQIEEMCDIGWSRGTFGNYHDIPFAKTVYDANDTGDALRRHYWPEVFAFGGYKLLIIKYWKKEDRHAFDRWYGALTQAPDDDAGMQPARMALLGKQYDIGSWGGLYVKVCETLLLHHPYTIAVLNKDTDLNPGDQINFSYLQSDIKTGAARLSNGLWVNASGGAGDIKKYCYLLLEKCGLLHTDLQIETTEDKL